MHVINKVRVGRRWKGAVVGATDHGGGRNRPLWPGQKNAVAQATRHNDSGGWVRQQCRQHGAGDTGSGCDGTGRWRWQHKVAALGGSDGDSRVVARGGRGNACS